MKIFILILYIFLCPLISFAYDKDELERMLDTKIKEINPTPFPLIFEVITKYNNLFYIDETGRYVIRGNIVDLDNNIDLTEKKKGTLELVDFEVLPLKNAIKYGHGMKKLAVFHDSDCQFCRKLHKQLKILEGVQIYNFLFNLSNHPEAYEKAQKVYCSKDPISALDDAMVGNNLVDLKVCKTDIVDKNNRLAQKLGINSTPYMVLGNGLVINGLRPASLIMKYLEKK